MTRPSFLKSINLEHFPSRRLAGNEVVIEVNNKVRFEKLTVPTVIKTSGIVDTLLNSFTLPEYCLNIGITEKRTRNAAVKSYINFICAKYGSYEKPAKRIPPSSITYWKKLLLSKTSSYQTWNHMSQLLKVLKITLSKSHGKVQNWPLEQKSIYFQLREVTPTKPKHTKRPGLNMYLGIPEEEFSNRELLLGIRHGSMWLLSKMTEIRKTLHKNPLLSDCLSKLSDQRLSDLERSFKGFGHRPHKLSEKQRQILSATWQSIASHPLLSEWQCYQWSKIYNTIDNLEPAPLTKTEQDLLISRCLEGKEATSSSLKGFGAKDHQWSSLNKLLGRAGRVHKSFPCFWGTDWFIHTNLERLLMVWLLASERAQKIGIQRLSLNSIHFDGNSSKSLTISTLKARRANVSLTNVETNIYRKNEPPFTAYSNWYDQEQFSISTIRDYNPNHLFANAPNEVLAGTVIKNRIKNNTRYSRNSLPLLLLSVTGSEWQKKFLSESQKASREAAAFIRILKTFREKRNTQPQSAISLTSSPIGQSLIIERERQNYQGSHQQEEVEANAMGHNLQTAKNIYKDGFVDIGVEALCEPVRHFARSVGDEKFKLAKKLANTLNQRVQGVSLAKLEELCGIKTSQAEQKDLLHALDEQGKLLISGEVVNGNKLLIVETDFSAALMWSYILFLESALPELIETERTQTTTKLVATLIHLHQCYSRLDEKIQLQGKTLAKQMNISFPPIN